MVYSKYNLLLKAKLVHTQVPDAASHDDPDQRAQCDNPSYGPKHGKTWYTATNMVKFCIQLKNMVKDGFQKYILL